MKIKIFLVCMLLITSILQFSSMVFAGDETDPEIVDEEYDLFGPWADPVSQPQYAYLDIDSAWFTEDENEPDYLFLYEKVKDLEYKKLRSIYSMHWDYDGTKYAAGTHTHTFGTYKVFISGKSKGEYFNINGEYDLENNYVIFRVPKFLVGNPGQGDVLTNTEAWSALRYRAELLTLIYGDGELIKDWAGYGRDYTVQYDSIGIPYMHRIFGSAAIKPNREYIYNFEATDPQDEEVYYYIDWGDGNIVDWTGPFTSDNPEIFTHTWDSVGSYTIKAKSKDANGYESDWAIMNINVKKSRTREIFIHDFLMKHPLIRILLQEILKI